MQCVLCEDVSDADALKFETDSGDKDEWAHKKETSDSAWDWDETHRFGPECSFFPLMIRSLTLTGLSRHITV